MFGPATCLRATLAAFGAGLALASAAAAQNAAGQEPRTSLRGHVVDRRTGRPVGGARVYISGVRDTLRAGSDGSFAAERTAMGSHVVEVNAIGYSSTRWLLELGEAATDMLFEIEPSLPVLDTIDVPGTARPIIDSNDWRSPQAFEHRLHRGGGQFLTWEQIRHSHARALSDLLPLLPGVLVSCSNRMCQVRMLTSAGPCVPEYYLDGAPASYSTGPSFPILGVRGIEVYRAADAPIEFSHPNFTCGLIAIWTKMER